MDYSKMGIQCTEAQMKNGTCSININNILNQKNSESNISNGFLVPDITNVQWIFIAIILLLLSFIGREITTWYMKINQLINLIKQNNNLLEEGNRYKKIIISKLETKNVNLEKNKGLEYPNNNE